MNLDTGVKAVAAIVDESPETVFEKLERFDITALLIDGVADRNLSEAEVEAFSLWRFEDRAKQLRIEAESVGALEVGLID